MTRKLRPCGTRSAYKRHLYNNETPCKACREANSVERDPDRLRVGEIEMAEALDANPPVIIWRRKPNGVLVHVYINDPHADKPGPPLRRERQLAVYAARKAAPECTDEALLAAGTREI